MHLAGIFISLPFRVEITANESSGPFILLQSPTVSSIDQVLKIGREENDTILTVEMLPNVEAPRQARATLRQALHAAADGLCFIDCCTQ